jgi:PKHD-type hydroxylase
MLEFETLPIRPLRTAGGSWNFFVDHELWCWQDDVFNDAELDAIIELGHRTVLERAKTTTTDSDAVRKSETSFIYPHDYSAWIFERLTGLVWNMNQAHFRFDLSAFEQGLQFTRYNSEGSHYTWHIDRGSTVGIRKLSLVLQLSDPGNYEGGDLELMFGAEPTVIEKRRGRIVVFPSWALHRVTPVISGCRESLVAWISGPPFK